MSTPGESAVSEVLGQIFSMSIMSMVLITSLLGFAVAKDNTTERAVLVQGDALLQTIASATVKAGLFVESNPNVTMEYTGRIDLPDNLEGHPYTIDLDSDEISIIFSTFGEEASAPLFQVGAGSGLNVCDQAPVGSGPILLKLRLDNHADVPATCQGAGTAYAIFLENA